MNQGSSFQASTDEDDARALAAKLKIPWEDWVKTHGVCHHCGEKGHIRPKCPKYLADIAAGKIKRTDLRDNTRAGSRNPGTPGGKQRFNDKYKNNTKFKTLLAAFQAWSTEENDNDDNDEQVETPQENDVGTDDDDEAFGFFSALASLKE
jgi:hypothetical protein